jgi:acetyl-CoA acyltransferase
MNSRYTEDVVIVEAVRTPIGRGHLQRGIYRDVVPPQLLATVYREVISRAGISAEEVELAVCGVAQQWGEQGSNIGRLAWLHAGLPVSTAGVSVDVRCGGSLQALNFAASSIASGAQECVIAAGLEHMGRNNFARALEIQQSYGSPMTEQLLSQHPIPNQGVAAEMIADKWQISRAEMDEFAVESHRRAEAASRAGKFARESVTVAGADTSELADQGIRPGTSAADLAGLKSAFSVGGAITAGNSSQVSDGAAAVLLTTRTKAEELGLRPRARIIDHVSVGCDPVMMLEGPIPATRQLLERTKLTIDDIDRFEVNEAFAPIVLAWARDQKPDLELVNTRGGAIALGHPLGATGARLVTTMLHILEDDDKERGLVTMCCAGGIGIATLIERIG